MISSETAQRMVARFCMLTRVISVVVVVVVVVIVVTNLHNTQSDVDRGHH